MLVVSLVGWLVGCGQPGARKENRMIQWMKLADLPGAEGTDSLGVSAPFAGVSEGVMIVAGGCNFPDKPVTEGGAKHYYGTVFALLPDGWQAVGQLPEPVAYGAAVTMPSGVVCVGGNNSDSSLTRVSRIRLDSKSGKAVVEPLPALPLPMDNLAAAAIGERVYVAGGNEGGKPCHSLLRLNLAQPERGWERLADFPGAARVQPVLTAAEGKVYLAGGFQPIEGEKRPEVPTEVLVFDPDSDSWSRETELPTFADGAKRTLTGGCAVTYRTDKLLFFGGVNYDIFWAAIARPLHIAQAEAANDTTALARLRADAKAYMHHPAAWYRFNTTLLQYDLSTRAWSELGDYEQLARAGAAALLRDNRLTVINGELKPGIRTPLVNQAVIGE